MKTVLQWQRNNCYSFTDPGGMAGWVGLVGWLIANASPTKRLHGQLSVKRRIGKARRQNRRSNHYATPPTVVSLFVTPAVLQQTVNTDCLESKTEWGSRKECLWRCYEHEWLAWSDSIHAGTPPWRSLLQAQRNTSPHSLPACAVNSYNFTQYYTQSNTAPL